MSSVEKTYGVLKTIMLMGERFDGIDARIKTLSSDVSDLGKSQAELAQRVARLEGLIEGAAMVAAQQRRIEG